MQQQMIAVKIKAGINEKEKDTVEKINKAK